MSFLVAPENVLFSTALLLMVLIGLVEAIGLSAGTIGIDHDVDADGLGYNLLGWLGVGRLPLLMLIVVVLASFGVVGLSLQQAVAGAWGRLLPMWIAAPMAGLLSLPVIAIVSRAVARIMPRDETTAVSLDSLVGRRARIVVGTAAIGSPARARVHDAYGQSHYVLVGPSTDVERLTEGDEVLLVSRDIHHFRAVAVTPHPVADLGVTR